MENHGEEIETTVTNSTLLIKFNQSLIDLELTMELDNTCLNVWKKILAQNWFPCIIPFVAYLMMNKLHSQRYIIIFEAKWIKPFIKNKFPSISKWLIIDYNLRHSTNLVTIKH